MQPTVAVSTRSHVAEIVFAAAPHNYASPQLLKLIADALDEIDADSQIRCTVLASEGKSFCAGADLNWMKKMAGYGAAENLADARGLALMLRTLNGLSKPTVARVHGAAYGGGVGLTACCDIAIAAIEASFALSEAKLGLIPATISPYVIEAIGARAARRYFLTGERFDAAEAYRIGLVHDIVPIAELDERVNEILGKLMLAGPRAQMECKALIRGVAHRPIDAEVISGTAEHIAAVRASAEGKEGVAAFLDKRAAAWVPAGLLKKP